MELIKDYKLVEHHNCVEIHKLIDNEKRDTIDPDYNVIAKFYCNPQIENDLTEKQASEAGAMVIRGLYTGII